MLMTKLEKLINEYFATDDIPLEDHIDIITNELTEEEQIQELANLLHYLNANIE